MGSRIKVTTIQIGLAQVKLCCMIAVPALGRITTLMVSLELCGEVPININGNKFQKLLKIEMRFSYWSNSVGGH